jgi:peroxiredoxin
MQKTMEGEGLTVVGVSYDDTVERIQDFQKDLKQEYTVVLGGQEVGAQLPASPLPTTYIIDRQGQIREKFIGERSQSAFEAVIKPLLQENVTTARK